MSRPLLRFAWIPVVLAFMVACPLLLLVALPMAFIPSLSRKDTP